MTMDNEDGSEKQRPAVSLRQCDLVASTARTRAPRNSSRGHEAESWAEWLCSNKAPSVTDGDNIFNADETRTASSKISFF